MPRALVAKNDTVTAASGRGAAVGGISSVGSPLRAKYREMLRPLMPRMRLRLWLTGIRERKKIKSGESPRPAAPTRSERGDP